MNNKLNLVHYKGREFIFMNPNDHDNCGAMFSFTETGKISDMFVFNANYEILYSYNKNISVPNNKNEIEIVGTFYDKLVEDLTVLIMSLKNELQLQVQKT